MIAVLIAVTEMTGTDVMADRYPSCLLPLMDRPFVQHLVEYFTGQGVTEFRIVACHLPGEIRRALGNGERWGVKISYHLVRDPERPYRLLNSDTLFKNGKNVLLIHGDLLVTVDIGKEKPSDESCGPVLYTRSSGPSGEKGGSVWTGLAWLNSGCSASIGRGLDRGTLFSRLLSGEGAGEVTVDSASIIAVRSCRDLVSANKRLLAGEFSGLGRGGRKVQDGVWLSRNISIHPTARLTPPVYVGADCRIDKRVRLGPFSVVGKNCILDKGATVEDSVVFPGSYLGEGVALKNAVVDRNCLVNLGLGTEITVNDDFILGDLGRMEQGGMLKIFVSRFLALALLSFLFPVLGGMLCYRWVAKGEGMFHGDEVVRLPAAMDRTLWKRYTLFRLHPMGMERCNDYGKPAGHFLYRFLPALINVVKGDLCLVGVVPRTPEEIQALPRDWRSIYLKTGAGIVSEALVKFGSSPSDDELYAAETIYSVSATLFYDAKLLARYFKGRLKLFFSRGKKNDLRQSG